MTGFGDADKLAAAKEPQHSFATRASTPRGSAQAAGSRRGQANNTRAHVSVPRPGYQASRLPNSGRGQATSAAIRGRAGGVVSSPATRARINQRNLSDRGMSRGDSLSTGRLDRDVTFRGLPSSIDFNTIRNVSMSTEAPQSNGNPLSISRGLGNSRYADPAVAPVADPSQHFLQPSQGTEKVQTASSGKFVGFYQGQDDQLQLVPDEAPAKMRAAKGLQTSRFAEADSESFFSSTANDSAMTTSDAELDRANPRYDGYYQDVAQSKPAAATQVSQIQGTTQSQNQQGSHVIPNLKDSQFVAASPAPATNTSSSMTKFQLTNPALRESMEQYMRLRAKAAAADAMEVDEEL